MTARTDELEAEYQRARQSGELVPINKETTLKEWDNWILVNNRFPHNKLVVTHLMVVLKREASVWQLNKNELNELWYTILPWADTQYDFAKINFSAMRSVKGIPHIHLCTYKEEYR